MADTPASTQIAELPPQQQAEIVVTGSRLPRRNLTAASPVTLVDSKEVRLEGTTNIEELLNELPQVAPSQGTFLSNGATGTATVDLRSLGASRTLVLVNGRRLGPGDPTQPVADLNIVPPTLIKRVEVLTGGASSVYGSDAVAGVVNFILDTSLDGVRLDAQNSVFEHDNHTRGDMRAALDDAGFPYPSGSRIDGDRISVDVALGKPLLGGRAHVSIYGGYRKQDALTQDKRDYSACAASVFSDANDLLFCGGSQASYPGNVAVKRQIFAIGPGRSFTPEARPNFFNFGPYNYYQRPDTRYTAGGFADFDVGDAFKPFLEVMYLHDESVAQLAPSGDFGNTRTINCDNALMSAQQLALTCFDGNLFDQRNGDPPTQFIDPVTGEPYYKAFLNIQRRNVEGGPRQQDLVHKSLRLAGGLKGEIAKGVTYEASLIQMKADMSSDATNFLSVRRMRNALDVITDPATGQPACRLAITGEDAACVPWDIFEPGKVTQAALDYLTVSAHQHGETKERIANFNSTIDLDQWGWKLPWAGEAPSLNVGAEYRKDWLDYAPDSLEFTGDLAGAGGAHLPVSGSTNVKELFAETRVPIIDNGFIYEAAIEGGYRQSWYTNGQHSFSTNAYKLSLEASPLRGFKFRGSLQRAVRAPNIVELFTPATEDGFDNDPCVGAAPQATLAQCQNTGVTAAQYGHLVEQPPQAFVGYNSIIGGNLQLKPEVSTTKTAGLVLEPRFLPHFNATVDWWAIDLDGAVGQAGAQSTMDNCIATGDPKFCSLIHRDSDGSLWLSQQGFIDDRLINIAGVKIRGVDVGINYQHRLGGLGSANLSFLGTYNYKWVIDLGGLAEPFDCAGLYGVDCGVPTPRWRHKARLTWTSPIGVSMSLNWRYTGSMKLAPIPDYKPGPYTRDLKAQSFFDLTAAAAVGHAYEFRIGVNNLFDREPPLVPGGDEGACEINCNGNTYPEWYDPLGRFIFAAVTVQLKPF